MKKKIIAGILAAATIISLGMLPVSAAPVDLYMDQTVAYSGNVVGTWKFFQGWNSITSKHKVYFTAQYSDGNGWKEDTQVKLAVGSEFYDVHTSTRQDCLWRLELNPEGWLYTNCRAGGEIFY